MSSKLRFKFLNSWVQCSDFNFVLLSIGLNIDVDWALAFEFADFVGQADNLVSQWRNGSFFIIDQVGVWLIGLPFNVSFSQNLIFSFKLSEGTLES